MNYRCWAIVLVLTKTVCIALGPFETTTVGVVGKVHTFSLSLKVQDNPAITVISYDPPDAPGTILWSEDGTHSTPNGFNVTVINTTHYKTPLFEYKMSVDLPDDPAILKARAVVYHIQIVQGENITGNYSSQLVAAYPLSCGVSGGSLKNVYEEFTTACSVRYFGIWSPYIYWYGYMPIVSDSNQTVTNDNGTTRTYNGKSVAPKDFIRGRTECLLGSRSFRNPDRYVDSCDMTYDIQSCYTSQRCVLSGFSSRGGKPGQTHQLSTIMRKLSQDDIVAISYDPPGAPGTIIWKDNETVAGPSNMNVVAEHWNSSNSNFTYSRYLITIQLPRSYSDLNNYTVMYRAYMMSHPKVITTAKLTAADLKCATDGPSTVIVNDMINLSCEARYFGYRSPDLGWYNNTGGKIEDYEKNSSDVKVRTSIWISATEKDQENGHQCKLRYDKTQLDYRPPRYQQSCTSSYTLLYTTNCSITGSPDKQVNEEVELVCTTKYDGVNVPTMNWYDNSQRNVTTSKTTHGDTAEYRVIMRKKAADVNKETFHCQLKYEYFSTHTNQTMVVQQACEISYNVSAASTQPPISGTTIIRPDIVFFLQTLVIILLSVNN